MAGKISANDLKTVLYQDLLSVTLKVDGRQLTIEPQLYLTLTDEHGDDRLYAKDCVVFTDGKEQKADDFSAVKNILDAAGAGTDEYDLISIGDKYNSLEELEASKRFDEITMPELLERYKTADRFELVSPLYDFDFSFNDEQAEKTFAEIAEQQKRLSRNQYDAISEEERAKLPDFETLYAQIEDECKRFRAKNSAKIKKRDGLAFFCDEFAHGNTRFTEPMELWHVYHAVDFVEDCAYKIEKARSKRRDGEEESTQHPELENYPELQAALIGTKVTFTWHCTTSGTPAKVFSFRLNDETRAWLLARKDDYDMPDGLEDLALYQGERILFSSCTHEKFHTDCDK